MEYSLLFLLGNAVVLGVRHGIDWDHIAAIMDIVGTTTTSEAANHHSFNDLQRRALTLSTLYALGHASIVLLLGIAALVFAAIFPKWVDQIMERVVGITLLVLGAWIFYSLIRYLQGKNEFELKSRWMLMFEITRHGAGWLSDALSGRVNSREFRVYQYGVRTAFGVGMIHGIGAETGTQLLLISAVGGTANHGLGLVILLSFVFGLLISNSVVAVLSSLGFITSFKIKPIYVTTGIAAGAFSLIIGSAFASGQANRLPDLQALLTSRRP